MNFLKIVGCYILILFLLLTFMAINTNKYSEQIYEKFKETNCSEIEEFKEYCYNYDIGIIHLKKVEYHQQECLDLVLKKKELCKK